MKGYRVARETKFNWTLVADLASGDVSEPIVIPRRGNVVSIEIMMGTLVASHMLPGEYFDLRAKVEAEMKKQLN